MAAEGVPAPQFLLVGAIAFLLVGSVSVIVGYKAQFGAALLLIFLILASYYFHAFWKLEGQAQQEQILAAQTNEGQRRHQDHSTLEPAARSQLPVGDDIGRENRQGTHDRDPHPTADLAGPPLL